jgi:predicted DCC family thiol-disulfide oxidoreductase YuxK
MSGQTEDVDEMYNLDNIFKKEGNLPHLTDADLAEAFNNAKDNDNGGNEVAARGVGNDSERREEHAADRAGQAHVDTAYTLRETAEIHARARMERETRSVEKAMMSVNDLRDRMRIMRHDFVFFQVWAAQRRSK